MKKIMTRIIVFTLLLASYCPFAFSGAQVGMAMHINQIGHDTSLSQSSHDHADYCEERMTDLAEGIFQSSDKFEPHRYIAEGFGEFSLENESDPPHWNYFANNSDPPHLNFTGTIVSLE